MKKLIFVFMLTLSLGLISISCGNKTTTKTEKPDPCANVFKNWTESQHQINDLQVQIGDLKAENAKLTSDLACCESKLPAAKKTTTTVKRTSTVSAAPKTTTPVVIKSAPTPIVTNPNDAKFISNAVGGTANLDYLREGKDIIFCCPANNREDCYFPHFAMMHGVMFSKAPEDNQVKGYNWRVEPTEFYDGDYGVTVDGTFYVADNLIQQSMKAGGIVFEPPLRIKCPYTMWVPKDMTLEDGYWIYKTQKR